MKTKVLAIIAAAALTLSACRKSDEAPAADQNYLSPQITNIISPDLIKSLESRGLAINRGNKPPVVNGIYKSSPTTLISNYGPNDPFPVGKVVSDYIYHFYNQKDLTAQIDYKALSVSDTATGLATYLSGTGQKFSLFAQVKGTAVGLDYTSVLIFSGELASNGIKNLQFAYVITDKKGDADNSILMPTNSFRIYQDGDFISEKQDTYRQAAQQNSPAVGLSGNQ